MSYFATVSGPRASAIQVRGLRLVPVRDAQSYVRGLEEHLSASDGTPVYLCDDGTTGTSHDFVGGAEDYAAEHGTLIGHPMLDLLDICEKNGVVLRIWWADDRSDAPDRVITCKTAAEASANMLDPGNPRGWHVRLVP